tara:strand:- start:6560 stop:8536 length:1977 start_codon:yes stop_codon:yes gene_type:complete
MARVTGKYDIKFQRGQGAFDQLLGQYIGIRTKENKEQYLRDLKAASPKEKYEILRDLMKERRALLADAAKGMRPRSSGLGSTTITTQGSNLRAKLLEENLKFAQTYDKRKQALFEEPGYGTALEKYLTAFVDDYQNRSPAVAENNLSAKVGEKFKETTGRYSPEDGTLQGFTTATVSILVGLLRRKLGGAKGFEGLNDSLTKVIRDLQDRGVFNPLDDAEKRKIEGKLSTEQELAVEQSMTPKVQTRRPASGTTAADRKQLGDYYQTQIEKLNAEIADARDDYERAQTEYKRLLSGPDSNFALAAFAKRPSKFGEIIQGFDEIRDADPALAGDLLDAGVREFNPYEDLKFLPNAAGRSPMNTILESVSNIQTVLGPTISDPTQMAERRVGADPISFQGKGTRASPIKLTQRRGKGIETVEVGTIRGMRNVSIDDLELIKGEAEKLSGLFDSTIFDEDNYGTVKFRGQDVDIKQIISGGAGYISSGKTKEEQRDKAQEWVDAITNFEILKTPEELEKITRSDQPAFKVAKRIDLFLTEQDYFDKTRDSRPMRKSLSDMYNDLKDVSPEVGGQIRDEALNAIEQYERMPKNKRNPAVLASRLGYLSDTAKEIGSEGVLIQEDIFSGLREGDRIRNPDPDAQGKAISRDIEFSKNARDLSD